jgi:hypothetical protein
LRKEDIVVYTPRRYYSGDEFTDDEMGRHVARMGEKCVLGRPEGKMLNDLGIEGMIILKRFLKKYDWRLWTESIYNQPHTPANARSLCEIKKSSISMSCPTYFRDRSPSSGRH